MLRVPPARRVRLAPRATPEQPVRSVPQEPQDPQVRLVQQVLREARLDLPDPQVLMVLPEQ